jgi:hypothetical protein
MIEQVNIKGEPGERKILPIPETSTFLDFILNFAAIMDEPKREDGPNMLIHDGTFAWEGFGGVYQLAAGRCRLRIFDLSKLTQGKVALLKPMVVAVSDLLGDSTQLRQMSVRGCASHIATSVAARFRINPHRMTYVEYYPASVYGDHNQHVIPAKYDAVEFTWFEDKALHPKWHPLAPPLLETVAGLIAETEEPPAA